LRFRAGDTHRRDIHGETLNPAHPVGRPRADSEVSGGGSWRSPVRSYRGGRAKGWPHADDSLPGRTDGAGHGQSERPWPRLRRGRRLNWPAGPRGWSRHLPRLDAIVHELACSTPDSFKAAADDAYVMGRVPGITVAEVILDQSEIVAPIREREAARVPEHVRMDRRQPGTRRRDRDQIIDGLTGQ
jgi:hypothetical protein